MKPLESQDERSRYVGIIWLHNVSYKDTIVEKDKSVKNSQFAQPLFEFSGACAGCGETPYIKLITQLYGEQNDDCQCNRMFFNLWRFCSFNSLLSSNKEWSGYRHGQIHLFEDNAEYGFGMCDSCATTTSVSKD